MHLKEIPLSPKIIKLIQNCHFEKKKLVVILKLDDLNQGCTTQISWRAIRKGQTDMFLPIQRVHF